MALTLILGDQLHREWLEASPLQLRAGQPVLMIEDLAVASAYRYHRLRLLHTFVAMRSFRDALLERGIAVRYYELPASLEVPFWRRPATELKADLEAGHPGQGCWDHYCWDQCWFRPWVWPRPRRPLRRCSSRSGS